MKTVKLNSTSVALLSSASSSNPYFTQRLPHLLKTGVSSWKPAPHKPSRHIALTHDKATDFDCGDCGDCGDCACQLALDETRTPQTFPSIYSLELTAGCNNHCAGCGNVFAKERPASFMTFKQWESVLDKIEPHARKLKVTGGEPTLHPQFTEIIASIAHRGIPFTLFTNARWQDPLTVIDLARSVSQCQGLLISLHGKDAFAHEAFTKTAGSFSETVSNIRQAADAEVSITASVVLTCYNVLDLENLVNFALGLGVRHIVFNRYLGRPLPELEPEEAELQKAIISIETMMFHGLPVRYGNPIPQCFAFNSSTGCMAGIAYCTIDPWGNMRPCNHSPTIVGNLFKRSLSDLWQSDIMQQWRNIAVAECRICKDYTICGGGCKATAELRNALSDPLNTRYGIPQKSSELLLHPEYSDKVIAVRSTES